ncbi:MAG TPA: hypothetical protein VNO13_10375 [Candidatus Udaeobacter sp.]|nr:hypothetical protein [Candidatus Udaeobacter sp.]
MTLLEQQRDRARLAAGDELRSLLYHQSAEVLYALLENPALDETLLGLLLSRKDLPPEIIENIAARKVFLKSYAVKRALVFHANSPRLVALRLLRDLYLMDLVQFSLSPTVSTELKRHAEEYVIARLPQLPLGQRITLARRGPARVAGALIATGHAQVLELALDNPRLTEAQVLKVLWHDKLPQVVVLTVANHRKWSHHYNVRLALVRNSSTPLAIVLSYLPQLTVVDLRELAAPGIVPENLRKYLQAEVHRRMQASKREAAAEPQSLRGELLSQPKDEDRSEEK